MIAFPDLRGTFGVQFNFIVRATNESVAGEEIQFTFVPIFLETNYSFNKVAANQALLQYSENKVPEGAFDFIKKMDISRAYGVARKAVDELLPETSPWEENVVLLNVAWVAFV